LFAQAARALPIMPLPAHVVQGQGAFPIDAKFGVALEGYTEPRLERARQRLLDQLFRQTGIPLEQEAQYNPANFVIKTAGPSDPVQQLGEDESYQLKITPAGVLLTAPNPLGVLHGLQTFLQLVRVTPQGFNVPAVTIDDAPRFPWRGLLIDVSRHFIPISVIERNLDGMEAVKLNVFHWHLTDYQGSRIQSHKFPLLQQEGSDGLYYTQQQIRELVQYARDRGIRVVPEFEMPCHTTSWFVGYPQLASAKGPFHIARKWGVQDGAMDPTQASTYHFIDQFIGEMTTLFPDKYFHVGGDECNGNAWNANPKIQAFMRDHAMPSNAALQAYFTAKVEKIVAAHRKIMVGWDEVLQPETPKDVVIQSWRGQASLAVAARQGNRGILSHGYYLNYGLTAEQYYQADPLGGDAASLTPAQKARILGGEAAMWTEFANQENINISIWPVTAVIAERLWSPQDVQNLDSMHRRLAVVGRKLVYNGIQTQAVTDKMLQRMIGSYDPTALKVLAAVVQRVGSHGRDPLDVSNSFTPLNRLADAVPPQSTTAREFHQLAQQIASGKATPEQWQEARQWLMLWRDNDARLQPTLGRSSLTEELIPVSQNLHRVAVIGLQALNDIQDHRTVSAETLQQDISYLKSAQKPQAQLILAVAPAVELLAKARGPQ
ncbi:MAG: family 20 glycosylhydrolase, partial [Acidobacteriaceae bacterium]